MRVHLAAEGFDVKGLTHTVQYILPLLQLHGKAKQSPEHIELSETSRMVAARLDLAEGGPQILKCCFALGLYLANLRNDDAHA